MQSWVARSQGGVGRTSPRQRKAAAALSMWTSAKVAWRSRRAGGGRRTGTRRLSKGGKYKGTNGAREGSFSEEGLPWIDSSSVPFWTLLKDKGPRRQKRAVLCTEYNCIIVGRVRHRVHSPGFIPTLHWLPSIAGVPEICRRGAAPLWWSREPLLWAVLGARISDQSAESLP